MDLLKKSSTVCETKNLNIDDYILTKNGYKKIVSIKSNKSSECYDISLLFHDGLYMNEENFILSNGVVSHNSNLSIVDGCLKFVEQTKGRKYDRKDIPINDKESISHSSLTDLVGIFQFENASTKEITDLVKMDSINDITAVTSLIRPGPRNMGMDRQYASNKNDGYVNNYPEQISKHLDETHGILTYQEQCCTGDTIIDTVDGKIELLELIKKVENNEKVDVICYDVENKKFTYRKVNHAFRNGCKEIFEITLDNGCVLKCTDNHKLLTNRGWIKVCDLTQEDEIVTNNNIAKIISIRKMGLEEVYDIEVEEHHNYVANGIIVHNCMLIAQDLAGFTQIESNQLRSVLAKKKADKIPYYREKFIKGAMENADKHGMSEKEVADFFALIESFAEYGFNKCLKKDTPVEMSDGRICKIKDIQIGEYIKAPCNKNTFKYVKVIDKIDTGMKDCYEVETKSGKKIICTLKHKFNCEDDVTRPLSEIIKEKHRIKCDD